MRPTNHFHLAPRLRMCGIVLPLPTCLKTLCLTKHRDKFIFTWRRIGFFKMQSNIQRDLSRQIRDFLNFIFSNRQPASNVLYYTTARSLSCDTNSISMYQKTELYHSSVVQLAIDDLLFNAL